MQAAKATVEREGEDEAKGEWKTLDEMRRDGHSCSPFYGAFKRRSVSSGGDHCQKKRSKSTGFGRERLLHIFRIYQLTLPLLLCMFLRLAASSKGALLNLHRDRLPC